MDTNETKGATSETIGKAQEVIGSVASEASAQVAGKVKELSGKAQQVYGQATDQLRQTTAENPLVTLAIVWLAGFLLGVLLERASRDPKTYDELPRASRY